MSIELSEIILGVDSAVINNDEFDTKKLKLEFDNGLARVFAEIKDVQLRSKEEISKMSSEEFLLELENLDRRYESIIEGILKKQIAIVQEEIILEKMKIGKSKEEKLSSASRKKLDTQESLII